jgi:hypothetical protein
LRPADPQNVVEDVLLFCSRMPEVAIAVLVLHTYFLILDAVRHPTPAPSQLTAST